MREMMSDPSKAAALMQSPMVQQMLQNPEMMQQAMRMMGSGGMPGGM
jgi:hypothetical protein